MTFVVGSLDFELERLRQENRQLRDALAHQQIQIRDLQQTRDRFLRFFNHSINPICIVGREGTVHQANPAWEATVGHLAALPMTSLVECIHTNDRQALLSAMQPLAVDQPVATVEARCIGSATGDRWFAWTFVCIDDDGTMYAIAHDITAHKQTEEALRYEKEFIHGVIENVTEGIVACDANGTLKLFNRAARQWYGGDPRAVPPEQWANLYDLYEADGQTPLAVDRIPLMRAFQGEAVRGARMAIAARGQATRAILANGDPLVDDSGQKIGAIAVMHDITEQLQAEADLAEKEQFLRSIYEGVEHPIFVVDVGENGDFYHAGWNPAAEAVTGLSSTEIIGKTPTDLFGPDDGARMQRYNEQCLTTGATVTFESTYLFNGEETSWVTTLNPLRDETGRVYRLIGTTFNITERKRTERQLHEQQALLKTFIANAPIGIAIHDADLRFLHINDILAEMDGCPIDAHLGKTLREVVPAIADSIEPVYRQVLSTGQALLNQEVEGETPAQPGVKRTWMVSYFPIFLDADQPIALASTVLEITDRKRAELALRQSEERLSAILDNSPAAIYLKDLDGRFLFVNKTFQQLVGRDRQTMIGKTDHDFCDRAIADQFSQQDQTVLARRQVMSWEDTFPQADGVRHYFTVKFPLMDTEGQPYAVCGMSTDISDRKQAEEALHKKVQREKRLNQLASQIRSSLDLNRILETAVKVIRDLLQIDRCLFIWYRTDGITPYWDVSHEAKAADLRSLLGVQIDSDEVAPLTQKVLKRQLIRVDHVQNEPDPNLRQCLAVFQHSAELSLPIHTQSNKLGLVSCAHTQGARPWLDEEVKLLQAIGDQIAIAIDQAELYKESRNKTRELEAMLQELQHTQTQLVQSEKMSSLGQLVAGVAHEINNPVNFIYGNLIHANNYTQDILALLKLYQEYYPTPVQAIRFKEEAMDINFIIDDLPKLLSSMRIGAERIQKIVASLRNFSRMDEAESKEVDIHEGLESTLLILQNRLKSRSDRPGIQVVQNYGQLPSVYCFPGQLNQVFMNILVNAIDALEEYKSDRPGDAINQDSGCIEITTRLLNPDWVQISIKDNGPGIPPHVQKRLFDPFFTTKPVGQGTGLGMSISYQIITEKHGGTLRCLSTPPHGTEFLIDIPVQQHHQASES